MTYRLMFLKPAKKEWEKLPSPIREQFKKKLIKRLDEPHVPKDSIGKNCYKIKLRNIGYRLVYKTLDDTLVVTVVAVGKRDKMDVYVRASQRLN